MDLLLTVPTIRLRVKRVISSDVPHSILRHDFGLVKVGIASQQLMLLWMSEQSCRLS